MEESESSPRNLSVSHGRRERKFMMIDVKEKKKSHAGDVGPPATKYHAVYTNREEEQNKDVDEGPNDSTSPNPTGRLEADVLTLKTRNVPMVIGTWNVRSLRQIGKMDNLIQEMEEMKIDILGVA